MKSTLAHKTLLVALNAFLFLSCNLSVAQDTLVAKTLIGDWKVCVDEGYSAKLDSGYECTSKTTYRFVDNGTYSVYYLDANAVRKEIEAGTWRIVQGVLIMSNTKGDGNRPGEVVIVTQMIDEKRFYELKQRFRKFANGNMKSYPSYTYFVRVD